MICDLRFGIGGDRAMCQPILVLACGPSIQWTVSLETLVQISMAVGPIGFVSGSIGTWGGLPATGRGQRDAPGLGQTFRG